MSSPSKAHSAPLGVATIERRYLKRGSASTSRSSIKQIDVMRMRYGFLGGRW
jgi:hypothetical protein